MNPTYKFILEMITKRNPKKRLVIVDYGCGNGKLLEYLPMNRIQKYYGIDTNTSAVKEAKRRYTSDNINFIKIKSDEVVIPIEDNSVDVVVNVGVLQYLNDNLIGKFFEESRRILKSGGIMVGSCFADHLIYKLFNIYSFFLPHKYVSYLKVKKLSAKYSFKEIAAFERGLVLTPFLSNIFFLFFDAADKILFKTQGKLGLFGNSIRSFFAPLILLEFLLPINYGYTLFLKFKKL